MFGKISLWPPVVFLLCVGAALCYGLTHLYSWTGGGLTGWLVVAVCVLSLFLFAVVADDRT